MEKPDKIDSLDGFLYFANEREAIRILKEDMGHPGPWTQDPILQKYKFTNIRRRDDRVTKWIIENIIYPCNDDDDLWFTLLIARLVNWPPTLQALIAAEILPANTGAFKSEQFVVTMEICAEKGHKAWGGAYMIYPTRLSPGMSKAYNLTEHILKPLLADREKIESRMGGCLSVSGMTHMLSGHFGIGTFIAGQVAADLTYSEYWLAEAADLYTWAPSGPGSQLGLNYATGSKLTKAWKQDEFNEQLRILHFALTRERLIPEDITLHDVQNVCCEFGKYCKAALGHGKPKTNYTPETAF